MGGLFVSATQVVFNVFQQTHLLFYSFDADVFKLGLVAAGAFFGVEGHCGDCGIFVDFGFADAVLVRGGRPLFLYFLAQCKTVLSLGRLVIFCSYELLTLHSGTFWSCSLDLILIIILQMLLDRLQMLLSQLVPYLTCRLR